MPANSASRSNSVRYAVSSSALARSGSVGRGSHHEPVRSASELSVELGGGERLLGQRSGEQVVEEDGVPGSEPPPERAEVGVGVHGDHAVAAQVREQRAEQGRDRRLPGPALGRDDSDRGAARKPWRHDALLEPAVVVARRPSAANPIERRAGRGKRETARVVRADLSREPPLRRRRRALAARAPRVPGRSAAGGARGVCAWKRAGRAPVRRPGSSVRYPMPWLAPARVWPRASARVRARSRRRVRRGPGHRARAAPGRCLPAPEADLMTVGAAGASSAITTRRPSSRSASCVSLAAPAPTATSGAAGAPCPADPAPAANGFARPLVRVDGGRDPPACSGFIDRLLVCWHRASPISDLGPAACRGCRTSAAVSA